MGLSKGAGTRRFIAFPALSGRRRRPGALLAAVGLLLGSVLAVQFVDPAPSGASGPPSCGSPVVSGNEAVITCSYTGGLQSVTIPSSFDSVQVTTYGAQGGNGGFGGGYGGEAQGTLSVTPGQVFTVMVGGQGGDSGGSSPGAGGYGGGGSGGTGPNGDGAGGGGGSFVWDPSGNLVMAAGGGGGAGFESVSGQPCTGGGGGLSGQSDPCATDGTGGTQSAGGAAGGSGPATWNSGDPEPGEGGNVTVASSDRGGGGGGGGYYGGGAAQGEIVGGGGGSGYLSDSLSSSSMQTAVNTGNGSVTFSFSVSAPSFSAGTCFFTLDVPSSCQLSASGTPTPTWNESGSLPLGVYFFDNGDGTATLTGTAYSYGTYPLSLTASNLAGSSTQDESLEVGYAPTLTADSGTTFDVGTTSSYLVPTIGYPLPALSETGALPPGVTFVDNGDGTATLAGDPTEGGQFPLTLKAQSIAGTDTESFELTVDETPAITSASTASFPLGTTSSFNVTTLGYPAAALSETGALPPGFTFTDNGNGTATISGEATGSGTYPITVQAENSSGSTTQNLTLYASQPLSINNVTSAYFQAGTLSTFDVTTAGYPTPSLAESGTLPSGITFVDNGDGTATLSGTSTETGTYPLTFTATSPLGSVQQSFTLEVGTTPIFTSAAEKAVQASDSFSFSVAVSGYPAPSLTESGTLPSGVTFVDKGGGHGLLSGKPTATGQYSFNLRAENSFGTTVQHFELLVGSPPKLTAVGTTELGVGQSTALSLSAAGYPVPSLSLSGTLPPGLSFKQTTSGHGSITGHPTKAGIFDLSLTASNTLGQATEHFEIVVLGLTSATPASVTAGAKSVLVTLRGGGFDKTLSPTVHAVSAGFSITGLTVDAEGILTFKLSVGSAVRPGKYQFYLLQDGRREDFTLTVLAKK